MNKRARVLVIYGTRPEVIKLAPVIWALQERGFDVVNCATGQHREMVAPLLTWFGISNDHDLGLLRPGQDLAELAARAISAISDLIRADRPDMLIVQGDTTTAYAGALAGFLHHVPVAHVEAGLRTGRPDDPFPEEANRRMISVVATTHFAPPQSAMDQLLLEGIDPAHVYLSGNTVIDALLWTVERTHGAEMPFAHKSGSLLVLVTAHRRENFGAPLECICEAILTLADRNPNIHIVYPVHLNPNVLGPVHRILEGIGNVTLLPPLDYPQLVQVLAQSYLVMTDSGGIQEEAPALGKPVLILRNTTERPEAVTMGSALLVGTDAGVIVREAEKLLTDAEAYHRMAQPRFTFGDGKSAERIADMLQRQLM